MIDWGEATRIAAIGIGTVAIVIIIVALATWIAGVLLQRAESRRQAKSGRQKS